MRKKKVVYVISDIDKALSFEWIADRIDKSVFELYFVLLNPGGSELEQFLNNRRIPVKSIRCASKKDWPLAFGRLLRFLLQTRPDVVHCHLFTANILGLLAAKLAGVPRRIYTRHHSDYHFRYFPKGVKWDKLCNHLANRIVAPSKVVREVLVEREQVPEKKVVVVHHGFDFAYFEQVDAARVTALKKQYNPQQKAPVIGVISRFTELKGIQYIIPAFKNILTTYPDACILFFNARGDFQAELHQLMESTLPAGTYKTVPFENDLAGIYRLFDVFVQVSTDKHIEAFGQTYVEALIAGVPSVFTLAGIANDFIVDRYNALVVPFHDRSAIESAIGQLLAQEDLRTTLRQNGRQSVKDLFSVDKMIYTLQNIYLEHV
ncbi:MAG TPA: glycosyltransferase family 4 protein [Chitinophagaceae bacterium]|nr:glycosyltransferase family 4 protein [Chitinophagaceae bacterium]